MLKIKELLFGGLYTCMYKFMTPCLDRLSSLGSKVIICPSLDKLKMMADVK